MSKLTVCGRTDVGREREHNEDSFAVVEMGPRERALLVVCDGMGGHAGGQAASQLAVEELTTTFLKFDGGADPAESLMVAIDSANHAVVERAEQQPSLKGMGSTCVVALVDGGNVWTGHVGDSRLYHIRNGKVISRTKDHSMVQRMVDHNMLTPEEAKNHPDANIITQAIGKLTNREGEPMRPTIGRLYMEDGDVILLCSDGLCDLVEDHEIAETAWNNDPATAGQQLIAVANKRAGHDNITVAIARNGRHMAGAAVGRRTTAVPSKTGIFAPGGFFHSKWKLATFALLALLPIAIALTAALGSGDGKDKKALLQPMAQQWADDQGNDGGQAGDRGSTQPDVVSGPSDATAVIASDAGKATDSKSKNPRKMTPDAGSKRNAGLDVRDVRESEDGDAGGSKDVGIDVQGAASTAYFKLSDWLEMSPSVQIQKLTEIKREGGVKITDKGREDLRRWFADSKDSILKDIWRENGKHWREKRDIRKSLCELRNFILNRQKASQAGYASRTLEFIQDVESSWLDGGSPKDYISLCKKRHTTGRRSGRKTK